MANGISTTPSDLARRERPAEMDADSRRAAGRERAEQRLTAVGPVLKGILKPLASLRLTVWLLALSIFLVFAGTLVQVDKGIWRVMDEYFRTSHVWIPLDIFLPSTWGVPEVVRQTHFLYPGGWLLGGLLLTNLFAAHAVRFKVKAAGRTAWIGWGVTLLGVVLLIAACMRLHVPVAAALAEPSWWWGLTLGLAVVILTSVGSVLLFRNRSGISLLHFGLIILLISEFVTGVFANEGRMTIEEGGSANFIESSHDYELAIIRDAGEGTRQVVAVPDARLRRGGVIRDEALPFDIRVRQYMVNSELVRAATAPAALRSYAFPIGTRGGQQSVVPAPRPQVSGVDPEQKVDAPAALLTFVDKQTGEPIATRLLSLWQYNIDRPVALSAGDSDYRLFLRFERTYKDYTMHLIDFAHDRYIGTDIPKNYSSHLRLTDANENVDREVLIYMNHPLRYDGETFFQSSFLPGDRGTVLQVVKNPGWMLPYIACGMVAVGLTAQFGMGLTSFLRKRTKKMR